MKDKLIKFGIKVFVLADSTNGYVAKIQIYTGKKVNTGGVAQVGLCTRVVLDLMEGYEHSGHQLYIDNFYTSSILFLTLYHHGIHATSTAHCSRRSFPKELIRVTRQNVGHYNFQSNGPLLAKVWVDKRVLYLLLLCHPAESCPTVS